METPQHWNRPNSEFGSVSFFFQELSEIPQNLNSVEGFTNILGQFPLYLHFTYFPFFFGSVSSFFLGQLLSFWFSEKVSNSQFVDRFPLFWVLFLFFLGPFPIFSKSFKFSVYWSVFSFLGRFPLFLSPFPLFLGPFPISVKVLNSQFVDRFPHFLGPFPLFLGPFPVFKKSCKFSVCWSVSCFFEQSFNCS